MKRRLLWFWNLIFCGCEKVWLSFKKKLRKLGGFFELDQQGKRLGEIKKEIEKPEAWKDFKKIQILNQEKARIEKNLQEWKTFDQSLEDNFVLFEILQEEKAPNDLQTLQKDIQNLKEFLEQKETQSFLNKKNDQNDCYLSIHAGAGGTEAADWAEILYRMYLRWADKQDFKTELLSLSAGDEAGVRSVSFLIKGAYSYGLLKGESGVHRLVRISPFDSNARRHTSFASVFVWPEISQNINIEINKEELKIDTYRSSGAGGQHVNTTDSAVRITHIPTGLVAQCQNQRSQHANKDKALKMLKSALYKKELEKQDQKKEERESSKKANEWGSQIRSYILHPYQMVKDHRSHLEHPRPKEVLDGSIQLFITAFLKGGLKQERE